MCVAIYEQNSSCVTIQHHMHNLIAIAPHEDGKKRIRREMLKRNC